MEKDEKKSHHKECVCSECSSENYGYACDWRMWRGHKLVKLAVILLVLLFVFSAGYGIGKLKAFTKYSGFGDDGCGLRGFSRMMNYGDATRYGMTNDDCCGKISKMMSGWSDCGKINRIVGTITKIEGNKITVSDNSGKEQAVFSLAGTVIISSESEISLSSLGAGEDVSITGVLNKDKQFEAQMIRVIGL